MSAPREPRSEVAIPSQACPVRIGRGPSGGPRRREGTNPVALLGDVLKYAAFDTGFIAEFTPMATPGILLGALMQMVAVFHVPVAEQHEGARCAAQAAPAHGHEGVTAAVKATAAAVCPEGKEELSGRSSTSSCGIQSLGGRRRSTSCFAIPLDRTSAAAMALIPAAAALRPFQPRTPT